MSNLWTAPELPHNHLAVVPTSLTDLLLVRFEGESPHPDIGKLTLELFDQDASEAVLTCLSAAELVINQTQARFLALEKNELQTQDEVGDQVRRAVIEGALGRRKTAVQFIGAANTVLHRDYMADMNPEDDPSSFKDVRRQYNPPEIAALRQRTMMFIGQPALQTMIALKQLRIEGFPEAVRHEAELTMRIMYDGVDMQSKRHSNAA